MRRFVTALCTGWVITASGAQMPAGEVIRYAGDAGEITSGARQSALGGPAAAVPMNAVGVVVNPAVASFIDEYEVWLEGAVLYGGVSRSACAAAHLPLQHDFGVSLIYTPLFSGDIPEYDTLAGTLEERLAHPELRAGAAPAGFFHNNQQSAIVGLGKRFSWHLPRPAGFSAAPLPVEVGAGCSFKSFWQTLTPKDKVRLGIGVNMDIGIIASLGIDYDLADKSVSRLAFVGFSVRNLLPTGVVWVHSPVGYREPVESAQHLGIGYIDKTGFLGCTWTVTLGLKRSADYEISGDSANASRTHVNSLHAGVEALFRKVVALRAGVDGRTPTLGAGIRYRMVSIDYALRFDEVAISPVRLAVGAHF